MSPKYAKDQPAGFANRIEKVAIVGAGGNIGGYFARSLLAAGKHQITALARAGSKAKLPEGVRRAEIDYTNESTLVGALEGQEFLIITLGATAASDPLNPQMKLIEAAAKAGVPYVMPNAYGPDPANEAMMTQILVGKPFFDATRRIEELGVSSWVALGVGFWYEWSLVGQGQYRFGIDVDARAVTFFDAGEERISTSTWDQCGRAVAALLGLRRLRDDEADGGAPAVEDWAGRVVYLESFRASQKDMFESVKRVTGTTDGDWKIEYVGSEERYRDAVERMKKGDLTAFSTQMYTRVFFPTGEGDHSRLGLANEALGLPQEDMDESTREGFRLGKTGVLTYDF